MYILIPTVYRALLKIALSGTDHQIHTTKKAPDMQAVPSGSGRLSLGALQEQQQSFAVSHATYPSGKALITAALSRMAFTMQSGKVSQQHKGLCVIQTGFARMHFETVTHQHLSVIGPTKQGAGCIAQAVGSIIDAPAS